jgi:hypothetical protein
MMTSAPSNRKRIENFDFMVFSSECRIPLRERSSSLRTFRNPVFPVERSSQLSKGHPNDKS